MTEESDVTVLKADKTIDCSGKLCPLPVVEVSKGIRTIEIGQVLRIIATDPGSPPDMAAWSRQTGHPLLHSELGDGRFVFYFQRVK